MIENNVDFKPVTMPLQDAEFIQTRQLSTSEIARLFRIPPWMIGTSSGDSNTYANVESQSRAFVTSSLGPWLRLIEEAISADSDLHPDNTFSRFKVEGLLRADSAARAAFYTAGLNNETGWLTRAEVRDLENLPREDTNSEA